MSTVLQAEPSQAPRQRRSNHRKKDRHPAGGPAEAAGCANSRPGSRRRPGASVGTGPAVTVSLHQARVLLAEDDKDMRRLLAGALRGAGYAVAQVADGNTLLDRLARGLLGKEAILPDLIVSDIRMPGWTGLDVLAGLRRSDWATPVILLTAFGDDEIHAEAKRLGATLLLDKPFDVEALLNAVHAIVPANF